MDYVIVIILSDIRGMDGGRLEVVLHPTEKALELMELRKGNFNPGELMTLDYVEAGYCIFMQGIFTPSRSSVCYINNNDYDQVKAQKCFIM